MKKKITGLFLVVLFVGLFFPLVSFAGFYQGVENSTIEGVCYDGLVPCGKEVCLRVDQATCRTILQQVPTLMETLNLSSTGAFAKACEDNNGEIKMLYCQFCHFFVMINGIFEFVFIKLVPPIAVLMLVVGGIMFYFAGGRPELVTRGKELIKGVIIGLVLAYGSFLIIGAVLTMVGAADVNPISGVWQNGIFTINCEIKL